MEMIKIECGRTQNGRVWDDKGMSDIAEIYISHGKKVESLQFLYIRNEYSALSEKRGATSTTNFDMVRLDPPSEFLTGINFEYCEDISPKDAISAISFTTNRRTYGPYGSTGEIKFNYRIGRNQSFGGFHGTATSSYLETIGFYFKPLNVLPWEDYMEQLALEDSSLF